MKVPKLTKTTLVNTKVHLFIQYIHQLLRQEAFDESVMGNMIDTKTISLLQFIFIQLRHVGVILSLLIGRWIGMLQLS